MALRYDDMIISCRKISSTHFLIIPLQKESTGHLNKFVMNLTGWTNSPGNFDFFFLT